MDYTPISTRRVLVAFALTLFVALLPLLYLILHSGSDGPLPIEAGSDGTQRDVLVALSSAVLTAALIGVSMLLMTIGRRVVRRPART